MTPFPDAAADALRARIAAFLAEHGHEPGDGVSALDVVETELAEFLVAAVRCSRDEHPWADGPPAPEPATEAWRSPFPLARALADHAGPVTPDDVVALVVRTLGLAISQAPCLHATPAPWPYPTFLHPVDDALRDVELFGHTFGLVGATDWPDDPARREILLRRLHTNESVLAFVELDAVEAARLAGFLVAGPAAWTDGAAQAPAAAALVRLYGAGTRCFATPDLRGLPTAALLEPGVRVAASWSQYAASGAGCWGSYAALAITDGRRVAYLDEVWDVTCEG